MLSLQNKHLDTGFFLQPTHQVAQQLIGKAFVHGKYVGIITETESYIGTSDPACHAAKGKTSRTAVMFGPPAYTYVYLIYGMYHCLNIVTEKEGFPAAVLIRGVYQITPNFCHLDGPGKVCRAFDITRHHNNKSVVNPALDSLVFFESNLSLQWQATPRIGIRVGTDKLWRYVITDKEKMHMRKHLEESYISQLFLPCGPRK